MALSKQFTDEIKQLDDSDIRLTWKLLKQQFSRIGQRALQQFHIRQKVEWNSKRGYVMNGTITKINQKTVLVATKEGPWRVSPTILRPAK